MIKLRRVNDDDVYLNEDYIESIQMNSQNDTVVRVHDGTTYTAKEHPDEILKQIIAWKTMMHQTCVAAVAGTSV